jgi:uncharacterized Zn finger protein (UPF0148 family)
LGENSKREGDFIMAFCSSCGTKLEDGAVFCPNCGTKRAEEGAAQEAAAQEASAVQEAAALPVETKPQESEPPAIRYVISGANMGNESPQKAGGQEKKRVKLMLIGLMAAAAKRAKLMLIGLMAAAVIIVTLAIVMIVQFRRLDALGDYWYAEHNNLAVVYPIIIRNIDVGNGRSDGTWLNQPGTRLDAADMRYFSPVITYESFWGRGYTLPLKISIYNQAGTRFQGVSQNSYTYTRDIIIDDYTGTVGIGGWGNETSSSYPRGDYRVEVWYNDVCLGSKTVSIY